MENSSCKFTLRKIHKAGKAFHVLNESNSICYYVKQQMISFGKKIRVFDQDESEVALIHRAFSLIVPKYKVCISGLAPFTVKRKFALAPEYQISGHNWTVLGGGARYRCCADDQKSPAVFELRSATNSWMDRFYIEVYDRKQALSAVCIAIAIEAAVEDVRKTGK